MSYADKVREGGRFWGVDFDGNIVGFTKHGVVPRRLSDGRPVSVPDGSKFTKDLGTVETSRGTFRMSMESTVFNVKVTETGDRCAFMKPVVPKAGAE